MLTLTKRNHSRAVLRTLEVAAEARKQSIEFHFVFDGAVPPCKLATVSARRKRFGFKRTWNLQRDIIAGLKHDGFCYTVAPYEAEAQLVYMERCGMIQSVAACDADYFALGVRKLWWKLRLNHNHAWGAFYDMDRLDTVDLTGCCPDVCFMRDARRTHGEFAVQIFTVLSGNDYCTVRGVGQKKAVQIVKEAMQQPSFDVRTIARVTNSVAKQRESDDQLEMKISKALVAFTKPVVYCHHTQTRRPLDGSALTQAEEDVVGVCRDDIDAMKYATGDYDPETGDYRPVESKRPNGNFNLHPLAPSLQPQDIRGSCFHTAAESRGVLANERSRRDYATANGYKNYGDVRAETGDVELDKVTVDELVAREVMMHRLVRQGLDRPVRDPRARNAHEILQKTRGFDATQFVATNPDLAWPTELMQKAPFGLANLQHVTLQRHVIVEYFEAFPQWRGAKKCAPLSRGRTMAMKVDVIKSSKFDYRQRRRDGETSTDTREGYFESRWPSTHHANAEYVVRVVMTLKAVERQRDSFYVRRIDHATCQCTAGSGGARAWCKHVGAALCLLEHVIIGRSLEDESPTSRPCTWKTPSAKIEQRDTPVSELPFGGSGLREGVASCSSNSTTPTRHVMDAYAPEILAEIAAADDRELENEFFDSLRIDYYGEKCAAHRYRDALAELPQPRNYVTFVLENGSMA